MMVEKIQVILGRMANDTSSPDMLENETVTIGSCGSNRITQKDHVVFNEGVCIWGIKEKILFSSDSKGCTKGSEIRNHPEIN